MFDLCKILNAMQSWLNWLVPYRQPAATVATPARPSRQFVGYGAAGNWNTCEVDGCSDDVCSPEHRRPGLDQLREHLAGIGCDDSTAAKIVAQAAAGPVRRPSGCGAGSCGR